jgi:hypothetical protein
MHLVIDSRLVSNDRCTWSQPSVLARRTYFGNSQNSPINPTDLITACDSSRVRGRHVRLRGSEYHALASCQTCARGTIAPTDRSFAVVQRSTCSSDRKMDIVAQVNPMSSYQCRAGTRKWTTASSFGGCDGSQSIVIGLPQSVHLVRACAGAFRIIGMPSMSHAQFAQ